MKLLRLQNYFNAKTRCYIPKCKARCCADAPLPEGFLLKHKDKVRRKIFYGTNIGQNDPRDTYASIIYNTTSNPLQVVGLDQNGNKILGLPPELAEEMQIKSMEQIAYLLRQYEEIPNYCPFLTDFGKCNVYKNRPPICHDFGTLPDPINQCPDKVSRLEIIKTDLKNLLDFKGTFVILKSIVAEQFAKLTQKQTH